MKTKVYLFKTKKVFPSGKVKQYYKSGVIVNKEHSKTLVVKNNDMILEKYTGVLVGSLKRLEALIELEQGGIQANKLERKYLQGIYDKFLEQEKKRLDPNYYIKLVDVIRSITRSRQEVVKKQG